MEIKYLGTAAAEGWPALFCNCQYCKRAQAAGGKNLRTRSQCIIDDKLLVDFPADSYMHMISYNIDIPNIHSILITHTHQDHLYLEDLGLRFEVFAHEINGELCLYGNDTLLKKFNALYKKDPDDTHLDGKLDCRQLQEFVPADIEGYVVTPLIASHDRSEKCFLYMIEKGGKALLYGNDTGWFPQVTWDYLENRKLDLVSLDCTTLKYKEGENHMGIQDVLDVKKRLRDLNCISNSTTFVITHFSHNGHLLHDEIEREVFSDGILAVYDGFEVTLF